MPMSTLNNQSQQRIVDRQCPLNEYMGDSESFDRPTEPVVYSEITLPCKTSVKQNTRQNGYSSEEKFWKGKKPKQAIDFVDKVPEETKLGLQTTKIATVDKIDGDMEKKEDNSDCPYSTIDSVQEYFGNRQQKIEIGLPTEKQDVIEDIYNDLSKKLNPNLRIITSDDNRMLVARVSAEGATLKLGSIALTIPEGALREQTTVYIYSIGFRKTTGSAPLCPEVRCGPSGLQFETYVTLSVELFGNISKELVSKSLVFCQQEASSDWKTICEAGGSSFIKDNRSYILVNHFSKFKTTVEESNYDITERQLVGISASIRHIHGRNEILVEFRKVQDGDHCNSSNSIKYVNCTNKSIIRIEIGDRQAEFNHCAEILLGNDFSAVSRSIPFPELSNIPSPMLCDVYLDDYRFQIELRDTTEEFHPNQFSSIKKPQTNVNKNNLDQVCDKIEKDMKPEFEKWLYKDFSGEMKLAVNTFLVRNDNDFRKLLPYLQDFGMTKAAKEVNQITDKTPYNPSRRPLPSTEDDIGSLNSCEPGYPTRSGIIGRGNADSGPEAISFGVNRPSHRHFMVYEENPEESEKPVSGNIREASNKSSESDYENLKTNEMPKKIQVNPFEVNKCRKYTVCEEEQGESEKRESETIQEACNIGLSSSGDLRSNMNSLSAGANSPHRRTSLPDGVAETSQTIVADNEKTEKSHDDNYENQDSEEPHVSGNNTLTSEQREDESDYENLRPKPNEMARERQTNTKSPYVTGNFNR